MKEIAILGRPIQLQERSKAQMKGLLSEKCCRTSSTMESFMVCHCYSQNLKIK